jgi:hypothetical protein
MDAVMNGQQNGVSQEQLAEVLTAEPLTTGYRPSFPGWVYGTDTAIPQIYLYRDVELMMIHPVVRNTMNYLKSGIAAVEFDIRTEDSMAGEFIQDHCERFWDRGVPKIQNGYEYGWIGGEPTYKEDHGFLKWDNLMDFSPRDCYLLTQDNLPVGVRIKNVRPKGEVNLWMSTPQVPAKGLWYAHEPRFSSFHGQSALIGAWMPWRRLGSKDAAETIVDQGVFRHGVPPVIVKYPNEDYQMPAGTPNTTLDTAGKPRRYSRDVARQIAEWLKAGSAVSMDSGYYPQDMGGKPKWELQIPESVLDIEGLIVYVKHLWDQVSYGIGVPPELLQASEGGSGYSGRKIPREAFLMRNQRIADAILLLFCEQILKPLVWWNFGPIPWTVSIKNMLMTERLAQGGQEGSMQPAGASGQTPGSAITQSGQPRQPQQGPEPMLQPITNTAQGRFSLYGANRPMTHDEMLRTVAGGVVARPENYRAKVVEVCQRVLARTA